MRILAFALVGHLAACGFGDNKGAMGPGGDAVCGDGIEDPSEGCDDGNRTSGDGCSEDCAVETPEPACGNGVREVGEACDLGTANGMGMGCSDTCIVESVCGDGVREEGEGCDDRNTTAGDGCSPTCQVETPTSCELVPQSGCSGTDACDINDDNTRTCRAVTTPGMADDTCTVDTACAAGFTCIDDGPNDYCMQFCNTTADCGGNSRCAFQLTDANGDPLNAKVCSNSCGILGQTGCPTGTGCLGIENSAGDFSDCRTMGTTPDGTACTSTLDCLPGSVCANAGDGAKCREYCNVNNDNCPSPQTCVGFSNPLTINGTTYGGCR